jgi:adenosylcobyric acid synthase
LKNIDGVKLVWARSPADLSGADWIILPGSKHTLGDLAWLRGQGLDVAVVQHAAQGKRVLGICGGLQMLGLQLHDPKGSEGVCVDPVAGLGLLNLKTEFALKKTVQPCATRFMSCSGLWEKLSKVEFTGYEIHMGQTQAVDAQSVDLQQVLPNGLGWCNKSGNVLCIYAHGLFESEAVLVALFGTQARSLDQVFDELAKFIGQHFEQGVLESLVS